MPAGFTTSESSYCLVYEIINGLTQPHYPCQSTRLLHLASHSDEHHLILGLMFCCLGYLTLMKPIVFQSDLLQKSFSKVEARAAFNMLIFYSFWDGIKKVQKSFSFFNMTNYSKHIKTSPGLLKCYMKFHIYHNFFIDLSIVPFFNL